MALIEPFQFRASEAALKDLRRRLRATRWPDSISDDYGFPLVALRELCAYWAEEFDWRAAEAAMFAWPHFRAQLGPHQIHFVHVRGRRRHSLSLPGASPRKRATGSLYPPVGRRPLAAPGSVEWADRPAFLRRRVRQGIPLLLTHGWPGSFLELLPLLPLLGDDFDVVVPSLPGFGFSSHPRAPGCNTFVIAELWAELMAALGYEKFAAQGGDFGAGVATILGWKHAARVLGVHLNYIPSSYRPDLSSGPPLSVEEERFLEGSAQWAEEHGAYAHLQRREPQTLAYGLHDSPAGLAAWILERFRQWSDCGGQLESRWQWDDLLANLTLYWLTESIGSACRLYRETSRAPLALGPGERVGVPCAVAHFPVEAPFPPRRWVERGYNLVRWTEMPRGGHFAASEEPALLAGDVRAFLLG